MNTLEDQPKLTMKTSTLASRLYRLVGAFAIMAIITGCMSFLTLSRLKVNGPVYLDIVQQKRRSL